MGKAVARRFLPRAPPRHKVIHPLRPGYWVASLLASGVVSQAVEHFPGVGVMARVAEPFVDAPVGAPPRVGAAAPEPEPEPEPEPAQDARRFPGVARTADLAKDPVPFADVPGAAAPEVAQAALPRPGVAGMVGLANPSVVESTGAAEIYPRFYSLESDPACLTPASSSEAGAKAGPTVGAACNGARSATPITP